MYLNNEEKLKQGFVNKSQEVFSEIINLYSDKLYSIIYRIIENHDDIEDILQNTFLKAFKNAEKFRKESSIYTYLVRIAINEAKLFLRKHKRIIFIDINENILLQSDYTTVEDEWKKKSLKDLIIKNIGKLPYKYKEIIILRDIEGMTTKEVAQILNLSENGVKTRLHRARLLLKDLLEEKLERM